MRLQPLGGTATDVQKRRPANIASSRLDASPLTERRIWLLNYFDSPIRSYLLEPEPTSSWD